MRYTEESTQSIQKASNIISICIKILLLVEVCAIPLFFFPYTIEFFETGKLFFLEMTTLLIYILITVRTIIMNEFKLYKTDFEGIFFVNAVILFFSTIFSFSPVVSFFGYYSRGYTTIPFFLTLIGVVYAILWVIRTEVDVQLILEALGMSCIVLGFLFVINNFHTALPILSHFSIFYSRGFSPLLNTSAYSFFAIFSLLLFSYLLLSSLQYFYLSFLNIARYLYYFIGLLLGYFSIVYAHENMLPLIAVCLSLSFFFYLAYRTHKRDKNSFFIVFGMNIIGVLFVIGSQFMNVHTTLPYLSLGDNLGILGGVLHSSIKNILFGYGPDTFYFAFLKYIPAGYYTTPLFNTSFTKASIEIIQLWVTTGIFGMSALMLLIISGLVFALRLFKRLADKDSQNVVALCGSFLCCFFILCFVTSLSLPFYFIVALAIGLLCFENSFHQQKVGSFLHIRIVIDNYWDKASLIAKNSIYGGLLFLLLIIMGLGIYHYQTQAMYYSDVNEKDLIGEYNEAISVYEREQFMDYFANQFVIASYNAAIAIHQKEVTLSDEKQKQESEKYIQSFLQQAILKAQYNVIQNSNNPTDISTYINLLTQIYKNIDQNQVYLTQGISYGILLTQEYPHNLLYMDELGILYSYHKEYDLANKYLGIVYNTNRGSILYTHDYIVNLEVQHEYVKAIPVLKTLIESIPQSSTFYKQYSDELQSDEDALIKKS